MHSLWPLLRLRRLLSVSWRALGKFREEKQRVKRSMAHVTKHKQASEQQRARYLLCILVWRRPRARGGRFIRVGSH